MTTGKIEYSPDYKSPKRLYPNPEAVFAQIERRAELLRLRQVVVDIAKRWAKAGGEDAHAQIAADNELRDAVEALESHEAKQKK